MKRMIWVIAAILCVSTSLHAQSTNWNDVLVVVNSSSQVSVDIGNYFKTARSIPSVNVCSIAMPTTEEITGSQFSTIAGAIQSYMSANSLTNSINYIVTTKGVPLKVKRSLPTFPTSGYTDASSFDSDLCLINSNYSANIGAAGFVYNPYFGQTTSFSRSSFNNVYLVTRLTGYTYDDAITLITKAASPYHSNGAFIFDCDPTKSTHGSDYRMVLASNVASGKGYRTHLDQSSVYCTDSSNVLGYVSWGSNDSYDHLYTQRANPNFSFSPKALAETYVSSSGRSFSDSTYVDPGIGGWQSMIADLIGPNGVTGAKGYVYEPFSTALSWVNYLFDRWLSGYNLAESFYASSRLMSWQDVVIGDPKAKFGAHGHLPVELTTFSGHVDRNKIKLNWTTATESNNYGFDVEKKIDGGSWQAIGFVDGHGTSNSPKNYTFFDAQPDATNFYRLKQIDRDGTLSYSPVIEVAFVNGMADGITLQQNHPNPFNPETSIGYVLEDDASITLEIYSIDGRRVRSLVTEQMQSQGSYAVRWDGTDENGTRVTSGMYLYRMTATTQDGGVFEATKRMIMVQ